MPGIEYYSRFPGVLRKALLEGKVAFPYSMQVDYDELCVYRGVKYNSQKTAIDKSDFLSYMEQDRNPMRPVDDTDISSYSCSCFLNMDEIRVCAKFPRKNKAIARGIIKKEYGPININTKTSHVDLYLYKEVDPSREFEVVEKWEENG